MAGGGVARGPKGGPLAFRSAEREGRPEPGVLMRTRWWLAAAIVLAAAAPVLFGGIIIKIAAAVIALGALQGLWRGGVEIIGAVAGLALALPIALPAARGLDGVTHSLVGSTGLTNRLITVAIIAGAITVAGGIGSKLLARRILRSRPALQRCNALLGGLLGAIEGALFALMLLWTPLALEPIARVQMADPDAGGEPRAPSFPAVGLARAADLVRGSALGGIAEATNPFGSSDLLALASDFAAISRDPGAMDYFMHTPVMQKIQNLPSAQRAREILESDPQLSAMFGDAGVSVETLRTLMDSPTVLRAFDETTVVSDLQPLEPELLDAIRKARSRVLVGSNGR